MNTPDAAASSSDLLTTEEVMDFLLADANLRRRAATCVLPALNVGGRTYFRRSDLNAWHERVRSLRDVDANELRPFDRRPDQS